MDNFDNEILALSWNIATEPKLYRKLSPNPFSSTSLQIISERFPDKKTLDIIKAVVLAEPEGRYDTNFKQLPEKVQSEETSKQNCDSVEIHKRLSQFFKKYTKEFGVLPKEYTYNVLSIVAFGTTNLEEIEQRYSQNQRRELKLAIVNFIAKDAHKKLLFRQTFLKIACVSIFPIVLFYFSQRQIQINAQQVETRERILVADVQNKRQDLPLQLKIPAIDVSATIQYVGITPKGEMDVPTNTVDVGWFYLGPIPGEKGNAVIAGHFNGEKGEAGVFANLHTLKKGDKIYIEDSKGNSTFVVQGSRIIDDGSAEEVFGPSDNTHLNLITCDGEWDEAKKSYSKRLVVFTDILQE